MLTSATVGLAAIGGIALAASLDQGRRPGGRIQPAIAGRVVAAPLPTDATASSTGATVTPVAASTSGGVTAAGRTRPQAAPEPAPDGPEVLGTWETEASWYGPGFAGDLTANGETFDPGELTAAHRELPFDSWVRVTSLDTGRSVVVRINDRGPYIDGRGIDLSRAAAESIGLRGQGVGRVTLELLAEPRG